MSAELDELIRPRLWFGIGYAMLATVAVVSLMPDPPGAHFNDKLLHFSTYAGLSAGFSTLVRYSRQLWWVLTGLLLFGVLIEILQSMTGYRFMDAYDVLANSGGIVCGLLIRLTPLPGGFRKLESRLFRA